MPFQPSGIIAGQRAITSINGGLTRILDMIEGSLPGVQDIMVQGVLFDAIDQFCTLSNYWQMWVPYTIPAGVESVDLNAVFTTFNVCWILDTRREAPAPTFQTADFSGIDFGPDFISVSGDLPPVAVTEVTGPSRRQSLGPQAVIIDRRGLDSGYARSGYALVVCKPIELSDAAVPAFISGFWSEAIRDGALSRLYLQPKRPYSDIALAQFHGKRFRSQIALARDASRRFTNYRTPLHAYFARGRQVSISGTFGNTDFWSETAP